MELDWSIFTQPDFRELLLAGMRYTLLIAAVSTVLSLLLGTALAAARLADSRWLAWPATAWVTLARHVPGVFWVLFFYFAFPELLPKDWSMALNRWVHFALLAGIIGLTVDNGTYVSDIVRNGVLAVPRGEHEAAKCCGLTNWQQWTCCLLPVTMRIVMPPLANRTIHNFKNSSLCMVIGVPELTWATQQIESLTFRGVEATLGATVFYVLVATIIGTWARRMEWATNRHWRGSSAVLQRERGILRDRRPVGGTGEDRPTFFRRLVRLRERGAEVA
jgi:polar amino acid transport system permease protein